MFTVKQILKIGGIRKRARCLKLFQHVKILVRVLQFTFGPENCWSTKCKPALLNPNAQRIDTQVTRPCRENGGSLQGDLVVPKAIFNDDFWNRSRFNFQLFAPESFSIP